ncbi:hypothetical protein DVH24_000137 [Malus domestica]|uniref:DUF4005 domain-containing protein n=1 Tax=Malus domestica TaxID=3750 RepID=A0A498IZ48_MALDO|nr:hypothetical protein DVH24_000137 [Malus domestica]
MNNGIRMGPIFLTILDMAQVFGLRPLGRCMDVTHHWSSSSHPTVEGEAGPAVETWAPRRTRTTVIKSSKSESREQPQPKLFLPGPWATPIRKNTKSQTSKSSKALTAFTTHPAEAGRKKQKYSSKYSSIQSPFLSCSFTPFWNMS